MRRQIAPAGPTETSPRAQIDSVRRWYHTLELAPGVLTPGWFDLRPIVDRMPWPDVSGLRCLDIGTSDGFLAFELERRGAGEVVAADIPAHQDWDWELGLDALGPRYLNQVAGPRMGHGFEVAHRLLGSRVRREQVSVYDLTPDRVGRFDVVVCGSLLLHLRDPLRALAAIRAVCAGKLLCANQIDLGRSVVARHRPLFRLDGTSREVQWWLPNVAGQRQLLRAAGFQIEREARPYSIPFGPAHPPRGRAPRVVAGTAGRHLLTGSDGVPHHAALAC